MCTEKKRTNTEFYFYNVPSSANYNGYVLGKWCVLVSVTFWSDLLETSSHYFVFDVLLHRHITYCLHYIVSGHSVLLLLLKIDHNSLKIIVNSLLAYNFWPYPAVTPYGLQLCMGLSPSASMRNVPRYRRELLSDLFNGRLKVEHSQLENVDEIRWLQSPEIRIFLQLCEALATNKVDTLL